MYRIIKFLALFFGLISHKPKTMSDLGQAIIRSRDNKKFVEAIRLLLRKGITKKVKNYRPRSYKIYK